MSFCIRYVFKNWAETILQAQRDILVKFEKLAMKKHLIILHFRKRKRFYYFFIRELFHNCLVCFQLFLFRWDFQVGSGEELKLWVFSPRDKQTNNPKCVVYIGVIPRKQNNWINNQMRDPPTLKVDLKEGRFFYDVFFKKIWGGKTPK